MFVGALVVVARTGRLVRHRHGATSEHRICDQGDTTMALV
jgi:hypothetical protein